MDEDEKVISRLEKQIKQLDWRLKAVEKEQRLIREDILSGEPIERIKKRLLINPEENYDETRKKIDKEIKIRV